MSYHLSKTNYDKIGLHQLYTWMELILALLSLIIRRAFLCQIVGTGGSRKQLKCFLGPVLFLPTVGVSFWRPDLVSKD